MWLLPTIDGVALKILDLPYTEITYATDSLFGRLFRTPTPYSLIIFADGTGELVQYPPQTVVNAAKYAFLGGHQNILNAEMEAAVIAAGFPELIKEVDDVSYRVQNKKPRILRRVPKGR